MLAVIILVFVYIPWTYEKERISFLFTDNWCGIKRFCKQMEYCGKGWWLENCWSNFNFGRGECEGVRCGLYLPPTSGRRTFHSLVYLVKMKNIKRVYRHFRIRFTHVNLWPSCWDFHIFSMVLISIYFRNSTQQIRASRGGKYRICTPLGAEFAYWPIGCRQVCLFIPAGIWLVRRVRAPDPNSFDIWVQTMWEDLLHRTSKEPRWHSSMKTKGILLRRSQVKRIKSGHNFVFLPWF